MPVFGLVHLYDALSASNESDPRREDLFRRIENAILPEGGSAHVEELSDPYLLWLAEPLDGLRRSFARDLADTALTSGNVGLSRRAVTQGGTPALDIDQDLAGARGGRQAAAGRRRTRRNPNATTDTDTDRIVLALSHETGDLDHRTFVSFDLRHYFLRPVHTQMHAFWNVDAAGLIRGAAAGSEDMTLGTSGNRHAYGVFRYGLFFLCNQRPAQHGDGNGDDDDGFHEELRLDCAPYDHTNPGK
jgi:hypothetical protein